LSCYPISREKGLVWTTFFSGIDNGEAYDAGELGNYRGVLGYATLWVFDRVFPLTLTLSLREREQQASDWYLAHGRWANSGTGMIERRRTILPLPRGEDLDRDSPSHGPISDASLIGATGPKMTRSRRGTVADSASTSCRFVGARPSGRLSVSEPTELENSAKAGNERHRSAVNGALRYRQHRDAPRRWSRGGWCFTLVSIWWPLPLRV